MSLNASNCTIMHFGNKNSGKTYYVANRDERVILGVTVAKKYLGLLMTKNGKTKLQVDRAVSRANLELGIMRKIFRFFSIKIFFKSPFGIRVIRLVYNVGE